MQGAIPGMWHSAIQFRSLSFIHSSQQLQSHTGDLHSACCFLLFVVSFNAYLRFSVCLYFTLLFAEALSKLFTNQQKLLESNKMLRSQMDTVLGLLLTGAGKSSKSREQMPPDCAFPLKTLEAAEALECFLTTTNGGKVVVSSEYT